MTRTLHENGAGATPTFGRRRRRRRTALWRTAEKNIDMRKPECIRHTSQYS